MSLTRVWIALLIVLMAAPAAIAADAPAVHMTEPRSFGHFVGDLIQRRAELDVTDDEDFVPAALPQPGQLAYWLELRDVEHTALKHAGKKRLVLTLTYQLFYVPIDTHKLKIPASNLELRGRAGTRIATIPAFTFLISPVREIYPEKSGETTETFLKEDATPQRLKTGPIRTAALASAATSALALLLLAFHRAWWPFHTRPGRPFTEAARRIADPKASYGTALVTLHRAFDGARGERLLAADLDDFVARRPEQGAARSEIQAFFKASQSYFFAGDKTDAETAFSREALEQLADLLATNERAGA